MAQKFEYFFFKKNFDQSSLKIIPKLPQIKFEKISSQVYTEIILENLEKVSRIFD